MRMLSSFASRHSARVLAPVMLAGVVNAQPFPGTAEAGDDTIILRDSSESQAAEVFYSNSAGMKSDDVTQHLSFINEQNLKITVKVSVSVGSKDVDYAEFFQVEVIEPEGFLAYPPEVHVLDGDTYTIQILYPMF